MPEDYLSVTDLDVFNIGNEPTFVTSIIEGYRIGLSISFVQIADRIGV